MSAEQSTREILRAMLGDVPLTRGAVERGNAPEQQYVSALARATLFYPVFQDWPTPVHVWLEELERLAALNGDTELTHIAQVRTAVVKMRLANFADASEILANVASDAPSNCVHHWLAVTRARIATRTGKLEDADAFLDEARRIPVDAEHWIASLIDLANAELLLERDEIEDAEEAFLHALAHLPTELVEERLQALQSLGFIYITHADAGNALKYLGDARGMLRGAGIWPEVIQMNLVLGALNIPLGNIAAATSLLDEALAMAHEHELTQFVGVLKVMLARAHSATGDSNAAIAATLDAAGVFAEQGQAVSYMGMITFLSELFLRRNDFEQAYETLLTGVSIAKRLRLPKAERALRSRIERLRQIVLGPRKFEAMVVGILRRKKAAIERPPGESQT